jgi:cytochrome c oxidase subunit 2
MLSKLIVLPEEEFEKWYESQKKEVTAKGPASGYRLYQEKGCVACHSTDGSPRVGPTFKGLFGKTEEVISAGKEQKILVDEVFVQNYIKDPNVVRVKGYPPIMPKVSVTDEELTALTDYIKSLE